MAEKSTPKQPFYKKWWFWLIIAVVVIGIAGNAGNQPQKIGAVASTTGNTTTQVSTPPPASQTFKMGDKVQLGDYILTVNAANDCASSNQFIKPDNGNKFVTIDITQENDGADSRSYNSLDFKLQDDKDFTYNYTYMSCKEPAFSSGDLQKGQKTRGYLTFQIPKDNKPGKLIFTPSWFSSDQITIDLK